MQICDQSIQIDGTLVKVAYLDGEKYTLPRDLDGMVAGLKALRQRIDLFSFLQHPPETSPHYSFPLEWDNLAVLPVSSFDHWWNHQIKSTARNRVRQAEKGGLTIREVAFDENLLQGIVEIHNETPIRQGKRFPHYGMDLEGARRYAGTFLDRSIFLGAFAGSSLVGFVKLTINEAQTHACAVNILAMIRHRDKAPTNALLCQAVKSCSQRGLSFLVYERFAYGNKGSDGLTQFKRVNGFFQMDLPRYFIPLTGWGRMAVTMGLHRKLVDSVPESIMERYRKVRGYWYMKRFSSYE